MVVLLFGSILFFSLDVVVEFERKSCPGAADARFSKDERISPIQMTVPFAPPRAFHAMNFSHTKGLTMMHPPT